MEKNQTEAKARLAKAEEALQRSGLDVEKNQTEAKARLAKAEEALAKCREAEWC